MTNLHSHKYAWGCKEFRRKVQIYLGMIAEVRTDDNMLSFQSFHRSVVCSQTTGRSLSIFKQQALNLLTRLLGLALNMSIYVQTGSLLEVRLEVYQKQYNTIFQVSLRNYQSLIHSCKTFFFTTHTKITTLLLACYKVVTSR